MKIILYHDGKVKLRKLHTTVTRASRRRINRLVDTYGYYSTLTTLAQIVSV